MNRLHGRVALVTGAGSGLGAAIAERLASEGAAVACADIDLAAASATTRTIEAAGRTSLAVALDVTSGEEQRAAVAEVQQQLGPIAICVANAGIAGVGAADDVTEMTWSRVLDVNLTGVWRTAKAVLPTMLARATGSIITMASIGGIIGIPTLAPYAAAKGGVIALTRQMAIDYAPRGVRVNALAPGTVMTPLVRASAAARGADGAMEPCENPAQFYPLGRLGLPGDVAAAAAFLASDDAAWITGTVLAVDGGRSAS